MPLTNVSGHTFFLNNLNKDSFVVDLGAHRGGFSHEIIRRFECRCLALEANPHLAASILPNPRLTIMNAAVGSEVGTVPFYVYRRQESSSLIPRPDRGPAEEIQVPVTTLTNLLAMEDLESIDLLKMDVEGSEIDVLQACPDELLSKISQITVEFHDFRGLVSRDEVENVVIRMRELGFAVLRMWMRSYGDTLFVNRRAAEVTQWDLFCSRYVSRYMLWLRTKLQTFAKRHERQSVQAP